MSNYAGPSKSLDGLRGLIIRDDSGLAPLDITMLGRVANWLEATEMSLRSEQAKHIVRDTRKGEWPEPMQEILRWRDDGEWYHHHFAGGHKDCWKEDHLWLPAPPPPEDS